MQINTDTDSDEDLVKFFIWDGLEPDRAIEFVLKNVRNDMLPFTETQMKMLHEYYASFCN
jgi:hypothetical protein